MKKSWWQFWRSCKKSAPSELTAERARELSERRKLEIHEADIEGLRAWVESRITESVEKGWGGVVGDFNVSCSDEAFEVVSAEIQARGFKFKRSPKKKGYVLTWDGKGTNEEWLKKQFAEKDEK